MPVPGIVEWTPTNFQRFARSGARQALGSVEEIGHSYWDMAAPVSNDKRTRGGLKDSWFKEFKENGTSITLIFGASAPYAIFVELGTSKMGPEAPLRTTAGEMVAILPYLVAQELAS